MNLRLLQSLTTAQNAGKDTPLRELRSVVAGASTVMLDEEGRTLAAALRESLNTRVADLRTAWIERINTALTEGRVQEALRMSARPADPTARVPAEMAVRLADAAGNAMHSQLADSDWIAILDAVVESPVRRTVRPSGIPTGAGDEVLVAARRAAGGVPELAKLLGLPIPPPPGPRKAAPATARRR